MSTDLAVIANDPAALATTDDPAAVMVALVDQARTMLAKATGMEGLADVIEWKSRAEAIRVYTQQKDMGHEAELSAAEIVRRAERRIGQLIREGQAAGEIRSTGQRTTESSSSGVELAPTDFAKPGDLSGARSDGIYALTDGVSDERFEEALDEAKREGNMSRANIARKVKPTIADRIAQAAKDHPAEPPRNLPLAARAEQIRSLAARNLTSPQIADEIGVSAHRVRAIARSIDVEIPADAVFGGKFRKVDPNSILDAVIANATPEPVSLARIAYSELDRDRLDEWVCSLSDAIRSLTTLKRNIQKEQTRDR